MAKRVNSRRKGADGEREARDLLREFFPEYAEEISRGQQFKGGPGSPDVKGIPSLHVEVKRMARIAHLQGWMDQSIRERGPGEIPIVLCRADRGEWLVILTPYDFAKYHKLKISGMGVLP